MLELISLDLSNYCTKGCDFCYNNSNKEGLTSWQPDEVIAMVEDCIKNGVKAVSFGGGEPFEYDGIYDLIRILQPQLYVSITSNGLPLLDEANFEKLQANKPDKVHFTIHNPESEKELQNTLHLINKLKDTDIKAGVNLLVTSNRTEEARLVARTLYRAGLTPNEIIFVPQRYTNTPTPRQIALVAGREKFQSPTCLTDCKPSSRFCSVSWDKKVNYCSYAPDKQPLAELTYKGIVEALSKVDFKTCMI